jgi:hydroxymethylglutaryl-CoA lyase
MTVRELGLPTQAPSPDPGPLPQKVVIWEVGARDGLQNEKTAVDVGVKLEFLDRLADAGLSVLEATSFVHPRWVPQLADASELMSRLRRRQGVSYPVLVPNEQGLERAIEAGAEDIAIFASATEAFARRNLNRSFDEQFAMFEPVVSRAHAEGLRVRGYLSMCFGDPWEGPVSAEQVVTAATRLLGLGCFQISLGDTIGVGTAGQVETLLGAFRDRSVHVGDLAVHFHDTYGQALANTLAALKCGVSVVDSSAGGLGGCPFAKSATGNLATEDLVWMLDGLGIEHGADLGKLAATSAWMAKVLGRPSPSRVVTALTGD